MSEPENPRAVPGDNNPPAPTPPPEMPVAPDVALIEEVIRAENKALLDGAEEWIASVARAPAVIETEKQAEGFATTISELGKAARGAEKVHASLKEPWFKITKAIDAIFLAGLVKRADAAAAVMVQRQKVWIAKVRAAEQKKAQDDARAAQAAADALRDEEARKLREAEKAQDRGDMDGAATILNEAVEANQAAQQSEQVAAVATERAEGKTADLVRTHHAAGVTTSARGFWNAELLPLAGLKPEEELEFWRKLAPYIGPDVRLKAAKAVVKAGLRECPGIKIFEDFTPINR